MSDVVMMYRALRSERRLHHSRAVAVIAERLDIDQATTLGVIRRAEADEQRRLGFSI